MKKDFSETLKDLRIQAGYTQKQVYDLLGIRQSTFSAWETGRAEPSADMLLKLCKLYKVNDIFSAFGYDGYNEDGSIQLNLPEIELVENYRKLDPQGKEHINTILDWEAKRTTTIAGQAARIAELEQSNITQLPDRSYLEPNAAHERTDIKVTDKIREHDDALMDNDDEWK